MRQLLWLVALVVSLFWTNACQADYLITNHAAHLRQQPTAQSTSLQKVAKGKCLRLLDDQQTDGYYSAEPCLGGPAGWVYRTLVRRYPGGPPESGPTPGGGVEPGSGGSDAGTGIDVSAYAIPNCDESGYTSSPQWIKDLNRLKNRTHGPASDQIQPVPLGTLLASGDDRNRWSTNTAVEVTGYVTRIEREGPESCNCKNPEDKYHDTHIALTPGPGYSGEPMIVEITPQWRSYMDAQGEDWSSLEATLENRWITIQGWLFYDRQHANAAANTSPDNDNPWRQTAWEVHPITSLKITSGPNP